MTVKKIKDKMWSEYCGYRWAWHNRMHAYEQTENAAYLEGANQFEYKAQALEELADELFNLNFYSMWLNGECI